MSRPVEFKQNLSTEAKAMRSWRTSSKDGIPSETSLTDHDVLSA